MAIVISRTSHENLVNGANADALHSHAGGGGGLDALPGSFRDTGSVNIATSASTVGLDAELLDPDNNYSLASSEITVTNGGYYHVSYSMPINDDGTAGTTRGRQFGWVELDSGGGYGVVLQSRSQCYHREASGGSGISAGFDMLIPAGAKIRLRVQSSSSVDTSTEVGEAQLSLHRVRLP